LISALAVAYADGDCCDDGFQYGGNEDFFGSSCLENGEVVTEYQCTLSSHFLKKIFECIREMVEPKSCDIPIVKFVRNPRTGYTQEKGFQIARLLGYAVTLVPVDIFRDYYYAYEHRKYVKCFTMLARLFCCELRYEELVMRLMRRYNDGCAERNCPTHFAFFDGDNPVIESFAIARNIEACCKLSPCDFTYFYLPREVLCLDDWLRFSPEFDYFVLEMLWCVCEKLTPLVELYKFHLDHFNKTCINWNSARRECCITNLKIFSFYIIAICIPCYGKNPDFDKTCVYLLDLFRENRTTIAEHISIGYNILSKSN